MFRKLFTILLGIVLLGGFAAAEADGKKGKLVLLVDTHGFATFDPGEAGPLGGFPFYISGDICKETKLTGAPSSCTPIGVFHCWKRAGAGLKWWPSTPSSGMASHDGVRVALARLAPLTFKRGWHPNRE